MAALAARAVRRQWPEGLLVLMWGLLPIALISASTSKLYHYMYPFLPPLALAVGYLATLMLQLGPRPFSRAVVWFNEFLCRLFPRVGAALRHGVPQRLLLTVSVAAACLAVVSLTYGPIRFAVGGTEIRNSGVFRPVLVGFASALFAGSVRDMSRTWLVLLVLALMPLPAYRQSIGALASARNPMRTARDCVVRVQSQTDGAVRPGLDVEVPDTSMSHSLYYYFRHVRPWTRAGLASSFDQSVDASAGGQPALVQTTGLEEGSGSEPSGDGRRRAASPAARIDFNTPSRVTLLLPGPYAVCAGERADGV
jgi:hypothetical protein